MLGDLCTVDLYSVVNYQFIDGDEKPEQDENILTEMSRLEIDLATDKCLRHTVGGVMLVSHKRTPHVILLEAPTGQMVVPSGKLVNGEDSVTGLNRILNEWLQSCDDEYYSDDDTGMVSVSKMDDPPSSLIHKQSTDMTADRSDHGSSSMDHKSMTDKQSKDINGSKMESATTTTVSSSQRDSDQSTLRMDDDTLIVETEKDAMTVGRKDNDDHKKKSEDDNVTEKTTEDLPVTVSSLLMKSTSITLDDGLKKSNLMNLSTKKKRVRKKINFDILELISTWWRPDMDTAWYPYIPPHITVPKERNDLYLLQLPETASFRAPCNFRVVAVPIFEFYDNSFKYGTILQNLPHDLSRFHFICRDR